MAVWRAFVQHVRACQGSFDRSWQVFVFDSDRSHTLPAKYYFDRFLFPLTIPGGADGRRAVPRRVQ